MSKQPAATPESILRDHRPEVQAIAQELRKLIKSVVPEAIEKSYSGWHGIGYTHPKAGYFCCIFPLENMVKLAFEHGAELPDPDHLLRYPPTSGKQVRYLEFYPEHDLPEDQIVALLHAAIALKS